MENTNSQSTMKEQEHTDGCSTLSITEVANEGITLVDNTTQVKHLWIREFKGLSAVAKANDWMSSYRESIVVQNIQYQGQYLDPPYLDQMEQMGNYSTMILISYLAEVQC